MAYTWWWRIYGADPCLPESYVNVGQTPPNCPGTCYICAIFAENDGLGRPIIDADLKDQMMTAKNTCQDQLRVLLRAVN